MHAEINLHPRPTHPNGSAILDLADGDLRMTQAKNPGPIPTSKMSDRPRCGGFLFYNADRWRQEKEKGTPEQTFRVFTNESGVSWRQLSNLDQSIWDFRAAHTPYCIEKARKKGLSPEALEREEQDALLQKCDALRAKSDKMAKQAQRLERKAEVLGHASKRRR